MDIDTTHHPKRRKRTTIKIENQGLNIPKLVDAFAAGGKFSKECTLILTGGGYSVDAFAIQGIREYVGQDYYGVFPLKGKLPNVREASHKQIIENDEIQHIKQIIGLQDGKVYKSVKSLRYGQLIIMTNQDPKGYLIKGLFINFIRFFWPSLLKIPSFLVDVYPPIMKELRSITKKEAERWFQNLKTYLRSFTWVDKTDGDAIDMAFSEKIEERKTWMMMDETWVDHEEKKLIRYSEFINKELMHYYFSADIQRYIPSMVDGLQKVQRKILCCAFKHDLVTEISFAEFLRLLNHSAYHYDVDSLTGAIIGMANDFVGSNNVNLFSQGGLFGSRLEGGKDHVATRCLSTNLTPIARLLFPKGDDILFNYMNKDGQPIQPNWYAPVIPLVLVNGCREFGIGWSTFVPSYNPMELCANVRRLLNDEPMVAILPWYKGFQGTIKRNGASYTTSGKIDCINDDTTLRITELPVHTWTQYYQEFLDTLSTSTGEIEEPFIKNYMECNCGDIVHFEINISRENMKLAKEEGLVNKFKLTTAISTDNMHLCDPEGAIKKYDNPEEILKDFFHLRLNLYSERKTMMLQYLKLERFKLEFKREFVLGVKNADYTFKTKENVLTDLEEKNLLTLFQKRPQSTTPDIEVDEERFSSFYNDLFLVDMRIPFQEFFKLQKKKLCNQVNELEKSTAEDLWRNDLDVLERELKKLEIKFKKEAEVDKKFLKRRLKNSAMYMREAGMTVEEAWLLKKQNELYNTFLNRNG